MERGAELTQSQKDLRQNDKRGYRLAKQYAVHCTVLRFCKLTYILQNPLHSTVQCPCCSQCSTTALTTSRTFIRVGLHYRVQYSCIRLYSTYLGNINKISAKAFYAVSTVLLLH